MEFSPQTLSSLGAAGGVAVASLVPIPQTQPTVASALIDSDFEPQTRLRSNTWPCQRPEDNNNMSPCDGMSDQHQNQLLASPPDQTSTEHLMGNIGMLSSKKSSSRRNAWGNLSYADLITQAITSSPEKRLTLSQIYDWMVTNVPYFKDKGDSNSSAGWKNSIRHNLSLHNKFIRVQNEGTGKSSWWMLNPDAKPGKAARRRATSMETSKYEKRRGRIRKRIEALKNGASVLDTPSPCSSQGEGLDVFPSNDQSPVLHGFGELSPEFSLPPRNRAHSNASSCGRLSPIPGVNESVIDHDNHGPPLSPYFDNVYVSFTSSANSYSNLSSDQFGAEQLAGSLANTMKINDVGCFNTAGQPTHVPVTEYNNTPFVLQSYQPAQGTESTNTANSSFQTVGANGATSGGYVKLEPATISEHPEYFMGDIPQLQDRVMQPSNDLDQLELNNLGPLDCDVANLIGRDLYDVNEFNFETTLGNGLTSQTGPVNGISQLHNGGTIGTMVSGSGTIQAHHQSPSSLIHHHAPNATPTSSSAFTSHQQAMVAGTAGQQWVH